MVNRELWLREWSQKDAQTSVIENALDEFVLKKIDKMNGQVVKRTGHSEILKS